jgi:cyclophilin family peptidyl-prolyl cis-trans isomerase
MRKKLVSGFALSLTLVLTLACSSGSDNNETTLEALKGNDFLITISTDFGDMKAVLHDKTPKHKDNFLRLVNEGYYDSLLFHRVMETFMIQGGDPNSKNAERGAALGNGGPGYTIEAEILPELFHKKGALAAARIGGKSNPEKRSSGSQFYIVQGMVIPPAQLVLNQIAAGKALTKLREEFPDDPLLLQCNEAFQQGGQQAYFDKVVELKDPISQKTGIQIAYTQEQMDAYSTIGGVPHLDGDYTVFGQVIEGLDVVDKIAAVATQPGARPIEDVRMYITVEEVPKSKIAKDFGYDYF